MKRSWWKFCDCIAWVLVEYFMLMGRWLDPFPEWVWRASGATVAYRIGNWLYGLPATEKEGEEHA